MPWLAPECIISVDEHTHASDVWSYGVLLYELVTNGMTSNVNRSLLKLVVLCLKWHQ